MTSNTRTPTSSDFGASHGAARKDATASNTPCRHRASIVPLLNS